MVVVMMLMILNDYSLGLSFLFRLLLFNRLLKPFLVTLIFFEKLFVRVNLLNYKLRQLLATVRYRKNSRQSMLHIFMSREVFDFVMALDVV